MGVFVGLGVGVEQVFSEDAVRVRWESSSYWGKNDLLFFREKKNVIFVGSVAIIHFLYSEISIFFFFYSECH
jgi:hypothetical protein